VIGKIVKTGDNFFVIRGKPEDINELVVEASGDPIVELTANNHKLISPKQRAKIMALCGEIGFQYNGVRDKSFYRIMKDTYCADKRVPEFSLSYKHDNCASQELAGDFIDWLIDFCLRNGIQTRFRLFELAEDLHKYMYSALMTRTCAVCGRPHANVDHFFAVGGGANRDKLNQENMYYLSLCNEHHMQKHQGVEEFLAKWHIIPIKLGDRERKILGLGKVDSEAPVRKLMKEFDESKLLEEWKK
jgi:hypothetical protein